MEQDFRPCGPLLFSSRGGFIDFLLGRTKIVAKLCDLQDARRMGSILSPKDRGMLITPAFVSPEMLQYRAASEADDAWALGCVCFETWTGRQAFPDPSPLELQTAIRSGSRSDDSDLFALLAGSRQDEEMARTCIDCLLTVDIEKMWRPRTLADRIDRFLYRLT